MLIIKASGLQEAESGARKGLVLSTDDPVESERGLVLSTDDPDTSSKPSKAKPAGLGLVLCTEDIEESKEQPSGPTWIITTESVPATSSGQAQMAACILPEPEMSSTKVGGSKVRINPNMPVEEKHRLIAQAMQTQLKEEISCAQVNEAAVNNSGPQKGGGLFGSRNAASHDLDKEKQHKYFNRIDTTYMM